MGLMPRSSLLQLRPNPFYQPLNWGHARWGPTPQPGPSTPWSQLPIQASPGSHPKSTSRNALCPQAPPPRVKELSGIRASEFSHPSTPVTPLPSPQGFCLSSKANCPSHLPGILPGSAPGLSMCSQRLLHFCLLHISP